MSTVEKYTETEWNAIAALPQLVGGVVAGADSSGLVGSTKEMFETATSFIGGREKYPNNPIIQAIVPNTKDPKLAMSEAKAGRTRIMDQIKSYNVDSKEGLATKVLEECTHAMSVLKDKESETTVSEYKAWLLDIADQVAHAGTEGDILGFGGVKFSDKEKAVIETLKTALK